MHSVFDYRYDSKYEDDIPFCYDFPEQYLKQAEQSVGEWIVYRETMSGGGTGCYIAVAKVVAIEPYTSKPGRYYARIANFLQFDTFVKLRKPDSSYYEDFLNEASSSNPGHMLQGKSIRGISENNFYAICVAGFKFITNPANMIRYELGLTKEDKEVVEFIAIPESEKKRRVIQMLTNRKLRDVAFRKTVLDAYDNRCAVTGWRIINGGGKAEAQAAHILPVKENGPDIVRNGIALSATAHWLFDRHLISLNDECGLLIAHKKVPSKLRNIFPREKQRIHLPKSRHFWPHPRYVQQHREKYIAHNPQ